MTVSLSRGDPSGPLIRILDSTSAPLENIEKHLEQAFAQSRHIWEQTARRLPAGEVNDRGHFGTCAPNISDHGLMLAWSDLITTLHNEEREAYEVRCRDPWLYRHIASIPGVTSDPAPGLALLRVKLFVRGIAARALTAFSMMRACLSMRRQHLPPETRSWLLVYGHPTSNADGHDGYFGDLMQRIPSLHRVLHVDCPPRRARELARDGRTVSLHGFGSLIYACTVAFRKWRLPETAVTGPHAWLVRRAVEMDGAYAGAAKIAWQIHCQRRWLNRVGPERALWPWENHGWERSFCRDLRRIGAKAIGYQHSVVGDQWNLGVASNPDGPASLPDKILCNGESGRRQLAAAGHPEDRLIVAGALRFATPKKIDWDSQAPVFVALPFDLEVARQMVDTCRQVSGHRFVVRQHPMTPLDFSDGGNLVRADGPLSEQVCVSAVIYAATTVGLEAWIAGLPTIRFRPAGCIAIDIMPKDVSVRAASAKDLSATLKDAILEGGQPVKSGDIFSEIDIAVWESYARRHSPGSSQAKLEESPV